MSEFAPSLHPGNSSSLNPGGFVSAKSPKNKGSYIPTPIEPEEALSDASDYLTDDAALAHAMAPEKAEGEVDPSAEPWRQACLFLIDEGVPGVPRI